MVNTAATSDADDDLSEASLIFGDEQHSIKVALRHIDHARLRLLDARFRLAEGSLSELAAYRLYQSAATDLGVALDAVELAKYQYRSKRKRRQRADQFPP